MIFSWYIIAYLFLAGAGSGTFLVASLCCMVDAVSLTPRTARLTAAVQPAFFLAPALMVLAVLFLFADLGSASRIWLMIGNPFQSIMSMGAFLVALLVVFSVALCVAAAGRRVSRAFQLTCMIVGSLAAAGTMAYTGLLLSSLPTVDFWRTGWLVVLFVVSSFSCGAAIIVLADAILHGSPAGTSRGPWGIAGVCLVAEIVAVTVFIASRQIAGGLALESAKLLILGHLAPVFWIVCILAGLVLPAFLHISGGKQMPLRMCRIGGSLGVLVGGFALRYCVVAAALMSPVTMTIMQVV